jgi:4-alpha-glucanotransferase
LDALVDRGLLAPADAVAPDGLSADHVDYDRVLAFKLDRVDRAARALLDTEQGRTATERYREQNAWVTPYALYEAVKESNGGAPWWEWKAPLARHQEDAVHKAIDAHLPRMLQIVAAQMLVDEQWFALKHHANARGITIIGDIPIYVDHDSADAWAHRDLFLIDDALRPLGVSGVPPDAFSDRGQLWGNPLFDWKRVKETGFSWWVARMQRVLASCDVVRVDHFRAFAAFWAVPFGATDARGGAWVRGPGQALFEALHSALGALPIIAEDLGVITPDVEALRDAVGLPGMKVLQFAWGQGPDAAYLPHNHVKNSVVYTGTHDNDTSLGFWHKTDDGVRDQIRRYLAIDGHDFVWSFIRTALASVADTAVVPMQDVLCLDSGARMNTPAQAHGNWGWRVRREALHPALSSRLRDLVELYGRAR